ncbi:MAG: hypothetical protein AAF197_09015 [Pseudomonadota bacterium]
MKQHKLILVALVLSMLAACSTSVVVTGNIPAPLVERLPLTAKLNLTEEFLNYTYLEENEKRPITSLDFGAAQSTMFREVFSSRFTLLPDQSTDADLVITPEMLRVQYSAPRETKLNLYQITLRYRVTIKDRADKVVADWVINGIGKTPTARLTSASSAFNLATNIALRDIGAQITIGLPEQSAIQKLVEQKQQPLVTPTPSTIEPEQG